MAIKIIDGDKVAVCPAAMQSLPQLAAEDEVIKSELPILMNGEMVRSTLADRKTQTRRMAIVSSDPNRIIPTDFDTVEALLEIENTFNGRRSWKPCPFGKPGDRLNVRESWSTHACFDKVRPSQLTTRSVHYLADGKIETGKGRPSIHMPRWASRIDLQITSVRVERLQDITEADAIAEGIEPNWLGPLDQGRNHLGTIGWPGDTWRNYLSGVDGEPAYTAIESFMTLWESINGHGSWDENPYVWAINFKRLPG